MLTAGNRPQPARARLNDVLALIDGWAAPVAAEDIPLGRAAGRVLAAGVEAAQDLPPFDCATADGFALSAEATVGASTYNPLPFRLGPAAAGVASGGAAEVESGDPLPAGADAVVRLEHASADAPGAVGVIAPVFAGSDVTPAGSHAARGSPLLAAGRRLDAAAIGLLAAAGVACVAVVGRPRVRCLLCADHIAVAESGRPAAAGEVCDANGPLLAALIERDGGTLMEVRRVARGPAALLREALKAPGADIVLVAGGTGAGAGDHAATALAGAGELAVHGIALTPGETAGAGRVAGVPVFLLPGPPAACLWAYELLAGRAVRRLAGRSPELPFSERTLRLSRKIVSQIGMLEVCPVRCAGGDWAEPLAPFAEIGLAAAAEADGFVLVPEASEGYPQDASVTVYLRR